jgi:hypothetical protein
MPVVPVSDNTIIVKVGEVLEVPTLLSDYAGKEITVYVKDPTTRNEGEQSIFFTQGWLLGEGIAVQEVGHLQGENVIELRKKIADARQIIADQDLEDRIVKAGLVVVGKVSEIKAITEQGRPGPISEHDPQWQEAILEIETVLKGDGSLKKIAVRFPGSIDVAWVGVPKFNAGQEGIWILQRDQQTRTYTALNPLDFQSKDQLERIKEMIKRAKKLPKK